MYLQFDLPTTDLSRPAGGPSDAARRTPRDGSGFLQLLTAARSESTGMPSAPGAGLPPAGKDLPDFETAETTAADAAANAVPLLPYVSVCPDDLPATAIASSAAGTTADARPPFTMPGLPAAPATPAPVAAAAAQQAVPGPAAPENASQEALPPPAIRAVAAAVAAAVAEPAADANATVPLPALDETISPARPAAGHRSRDATVTTGARLAVDQRATDREAGAGHAHLDGQRPLPGPVVMPAATGPASRIHEMHADSGDAAARTLQPAMSGVTGQGSPAQPLPAPQPAMPAPIALPVNDADWGQAVGERVLWMTGQKLGSAEVRLNPAELGPLTISVKIDEHSAHLNITAHHAVTRDALEQALPRLRDMFAAEGLTLASAHIGEQGVRNGGGGGAGTASPGFAGGPDGNIEGSDDESERPPVALRARLGLVDTFA